MPLSAGLKAFPLAPSDQVTSQPFFDKLFKFYVKDLICNPGSFLQLPFEILLIFPHVDAWTQDLHSSRQHRMQQHSLFPASICFHFSVRAHIIYPILHWPFIHCIAMKALSGLLYVLLWVPDFRRGAGLLYRYSPRLCFLHVLLCI